MNLNLNQNGNLNFNLNLKLNKNLNWGSAQYSTSEKLMSFDYSRGLLWKNYTLLKRTKKEGNKLI